MRIAFVIPSAGATQWEARLVRAVSRLPGVRGVSVLLVDTKPSAVDRLERLRSFVERRIARDVTKPADFAAMDVQHVSAADVWRGIDADVVVLLTDTVPPPATRADFLELWFDGLRPEGLGLRRAAAPPPRDVVVTIRRASETNVAQRSELTTTPGVEAADRRNAAARSIELIVRALRNRDALAEPWQPATARGNALARAARACTAMEVAVGSGLVRKAIGVLFVRVWWQLAYRTSREHFVVNSSTLTPAGFKTIDCGPDRFWADPVVITVDGVDALFFEEYLYAEGRGGISCCVVGQDGTPGPARRVLQKPYHLSYPFVFVYDGDVFMIPESSENFTVDLYRCTRFPYDWTFEATLLSGIYATDATLHNDGARWWMFLTVGEEESFPWDELHLYMADSPLGPWQPHPGNPVKRDARSARPAGPLFRRDGRLIRPTQDCSETYGGAIHLCEIEVLTPTDFRERVAGRIGPDWFPGADGIHTLTATERIEVVDIRTPRRFRWRPR
jgi:hypothetical protein